VLRVVVVLTLLLVHSVAWSASRVAILQPDDSDVVLSEAVTRLRAELAGAGFEVVMIASAGSDVRAGLERWGPGPAPAATLALSRVEGNAAIDVWVADRVSGKTSVRRIDAVASSEIVPAALAIRAVDLLRASLLETTLPGSDPAPDLGALLPVKRERGLLEGTSASLGVGVLHSFAGLGPAAVPVVRFTQTVYRQLALRFEFAGPAFGPSVASSVGSADIRQELATCGAILAVKRGQFAPYFSAAMGAYHLHATGRATPPNGSKSGDAWAVTTEVGAGIAVRMGASSVLLAEVEGLVTFPGAEVELGGFASARGGRPSFLGSVGPAWTF